MIFIMSIAVCALQIFTHSIDNGTLWLIVTMLFLQRWLWRRLLYAAGAA